MQVERLISTLEQLLEELKASTTEHSPMQSLDLKGLGVRIPRRPRYSGDWKPSKSYVLDDTGKALLSAAKSYIQEHGALPSVSTLCKTVGIQQHHFGNRFGCKANFLYYLSKAQ